MAANAGTAYIRIVGDLSTLNKQLVANFHPSRIGKFGKLAGVALGAGIAAGFTGKGLFDLGKQFDEAFDVIRVRTGKTGDELKGLEDDFKQVAKGTPANFKTVAEAIGFLNSRLQITGKPLQRLAHQMVELSRVTGTDLATNMEAVTRAFKDFEVSTRAQGPALDRLFRVSRATGTNISELATNMAKFGSPLRQLGFDFDKTAVLFAKFQAEGVNIRTAMPGLRLALSSFAAAGKDPAKALQNMFDRIKETGSATEAYRLQFGKLGTVFKIFGKRAGADLVEAIRQGRFNFKDLLDVMEHGKGTIDDTAKKTNDLSENMGILRNRVEVLLEPLGSGLFKALGNASAGLVRLTESSQKGFAARQDLAKSLGLDKLDLSGLTKSLDESMTQIHEILNSKLVQFLRRVIGSDLLGTLKKQIAGISQIFRGMGNVIAGTLKLINDLIHLRLGKAFKDLGQIVHGGVQMAIGQLRFFTSPVREIGAQVGRALLAPIRKAWGSVKDAFSGGVRSALGVLRNMAGTIGGIGARIGNVLKRSIEVRVSAIGGAFRLLRRVAEGSFGGIRSAVQWVVDKIRELSHLISKIPKPKISLPNVHIPGLARGGEVKHSIALVGEQGPELVSLPVGSYVHKNSDSKRMAKQMGIPGFAKGGFVGMTRKFHDIFERDEASPLEPPSLLSQAVVQRLVPTDYGQPPTLFQDVVQRVVDPKSSIPAFAKGGRVIVGGETPEEKRKAEKKKKSSVRGKVSTFGPPLERAGRTASGRSSAQPGIALRTRKTLNKLFEVVVRSHKAVLRQIDIGPAASTGRDIDITGAGARKLKFSQRRFPTDSVGRAQQLARGGRAKQPLALVGEQGPEIVSLPAGSRVYSHPESKRMAKRMGIQAFAKGGVVRRETKDSRVVERQLRERLGPERFEKLGLTKLIERAGSEKVERFVERLGPERFSRLVERQGPERITKQVQRERVEKGGLHERISKVIERVAAEPSTKSDDRSQGRPAFRGLDRRRFARIPKELGIQAFAKGGRVKPESKRRKKVEEVATAFSTPVRRRAFKFIKEVWPVASFLAEMPRAPLPKPSFISDRDSPDYAAAVFPADAKGQRQLVISQSEAWQLANQTPRGLEVALHEFAHLFQGSLDMQTPEKQTRVEGGAQSWAVQLMPKVAEKLGIGLYGYKPKAYRKEVAQTRKTMTPQELMRGQFGSKQRYQTSAPGFAKGGLIRRALALVGEKGPELVRLPAGTQVQPAPEMRGMSDVPAFALGGLVQDKRRKKDDRDPTAKRGQPDRESKTGPKPTFRAAPQAKAAKAPGGILGRANALDRKHLPYVWGGGHGDIAAALKNGFDCSGAVSYVLGIPPRVSGQFGFFGKPGPGVVSTYSNAKHVVMSIAGRLFGTGDDTGPHWLGGEPGARFSSPFATRHIGEGGTDFESAAGAKPKVIDRSPRKLSLGQMVTLAQRVGFPDPALAAAVGYAESKGAVGATGKVDPDDHGLWQINTRYHPTYDPKKLEKDIFYNARAALAISKHGKDWTPWVTYKHGAYKPWLGGKAAALPRVGGGAGGGFSYADHLAYKLHEAEVTTPRYKGDDLKWINKAIAYWRGVYRRNRGGGGNQRASDALDAIVELKEKRREARRAQKGKTGLGQYRLPDSAYELVSGMGAQIGSGGAIFSIQNLQGVLDSIEHDAAFASLTEYKNAAGDLVPPTWDDDLAAANKLTGIWDYLFGLTTGKQTLPGKAHWENAPGEQPLNRAGKPTTPAKAKWWRHADGTVSEAPRQVSVSGKPIAIIGTQKQQTYAAQQLKEARDAVSQIQDEARAEGSDVTVEEKPSASAEIKSFLASLSGLFRDFGSNFRPLQSFAKGGISRMSHALVGEQGPEIVRLPIGSRVFSHPESKRIAKGMGMPAFAKGGVITAAQPTPERDESLARALARIETLLKQQDNRPKVGEQHLHFSTAPEEQHTVQRNALWELENSV